VFEEEQEFGKQLSLTDYIRILYRGRWLIVASFIVVMVAAVYITYTSPPVYQAKTTVLIGSKGSMERALFGAEYFGSQTTLITNQMEILKSRKLAQRTIRRLQIAEEKDSLSIFQPDEDGIVPTFRAMVSWLQKSLEIEHRKDTDVIEVIFSAASPFECTYITNIIAEEFRILNAETSRTEVNELRDFLERQISNKEKELNIAEEKLRTYQEREKVANLDDETTQLVNRLAQAQAMLEGANVEINTAKEKRESINDQLDERRSKLGEDLGGISTPYILSLQDELGKAVAERTKFLVAIESAVQNPNRISYESQIKSYDDKITALRDKLTEESKKLQKGGMVKDAFAMTQGLLTNLLTTETEIKSLTAKISALRDVLRDYEGNLEGLPAKTLELARLERDRKVQEQTYILMTTKLEETKITQAGQAGNVTILDEAIEPRSPISPNKKLNLMIGALIGIGLGVGLTFLLDYFDNTVKTIEEVEAMGFSLLGAIPKITQTEHEKNEKERELKFETEEIRQIESRLVTHLDPKSPISEAYRTLRTNLQFTKLDQPMRTILVTSAGPKDGKSTTVANLAITLAQLGSKVVLVDSDLRRPVIHSIFGLEKDVGLTNYMVGKSSYEDILKQTVIENLAIITCGLLPPNPSELLGSKKMEEFTTKLKKDFDIILFDSPPVIAVTDAAILSNKVDGTVLVVSANKTNRDAVTRAKTLLENVKARLVGVMLNNVDFESTYGSSYHYYYHYYYGTKKGREKGPRLRRKVEA
jgi:tyrosine-protein kinase Etk/Wzc